MAPLFILGKTDRNNMTKPFLDLQTMIAALKEYWAQHGCNILCGMDYPVGAGTFHPATFLKAIGPEPWRCAYIQPSRRPTDGRYGDNPNRVQMHHQLQVILKPAPLDIQELYLGSLKAIGVNPLEDDIRFVEDNWESPTLGAWGLGWEVWQNGMEISQFTYFQQVGGLSCNPVTGELTYGLERLAMYRQDVDNIYDLVWNHNSTSPITYGDLFLQNEKQLSEFNFKHAPIEQLFYQFDEYEQTCLSLEHLPLAAYEYVLQASHTFNLLDARQAIAINERQRYILRVRHLANQVAKTYLAHRESLGYPLMEQTHA